MNAAQWKTSASPTILQRRWTQWRPLHLWRHRFCQSADAQILDDHHLHGFQRPCMYRDDLRGSVPPYHRHVFLCFAEHSNWPPQIDASDSPSYELPRCLSESLRRQSNQMPKKTRFNLCEGREPTESSKPSVLIFPDMIKYKDLTTSEVDHFVKEVLVDEQEWSYRKPEKLEGSHFFVCSHGARDRRCGICGPALIQHLNKEISHRGLDDHVFVRSCSHVGGHKYAGNVIIYGKDTSGRIAGHWYGYVTPNDVTCLLDGHVLKGQIIDKLWRFTITVLRNSAFLCHGQCLHLKFGEFHLSWRIWLNSICLYVEIFLIENHLTISMSGFDCLGD